ncbi:MAG TPA: hypothetical protein PK885_08845, partial [Candidatus Marinimicrobia bacterium]|nr:hypothetical protein [Candidatus Neomarinimicrobiota bacterium]
NPLFYPFELRGLKKRVKLCLSTIFCKQNCANLTIFMSLPTFQILSNFSIFHGKKPDTELDTGFGNILT